MGEDWFAGHLQKAKHKNPDTVDILEGSPLGHDWTSKGISYQCYFLHGEFTITWDMGPQACVQTNQMDSTTYFWHCNFANLFTNQRTKNWLVVWNMFYFPSYMGIILPIDELIFFRRVGQPPADQKVFLLIRFDRGHGIFHDLPSMSKHLWVILDRGTGES